MTDEDAEGHHASDADYCGAPCPYCSGACEKDEYHVATSTNPHRCDLISSHIWE